MVVAKVEGNFREVKSSVLKLDEADLTKSSVEIKIPVASINTDNADRDKHLKGPEFFDMAKFPEITFTSTKIKKAGKGFKITGDLTEHRTFEVPNRSEGRSIGQSRPSSRRRSDPAHHVTDAQGPVATT